MSSPNFLIDTTNVPEGVDANLASRRNELIEQWRAGDIEGVTALRGVSRLYWGSQETASDTTRFYLADTASTLPIEAGIDPEVAYEAWLSGNED